ncbi:hypothetical protein GCM10023069_71470 [Shinella granuli]
MVTINAMAAGMSHSHRPLGHRAFDLDHFAGRIARKLDLARCRVRALGLKLDKRRRSHHLRKCRLELLDVVIDVAMQCPRHVAPVEHALFAGDEGQNLFRLLADKIGVALRRFLVQPRARHVEAAPLHLRSMDAHVLGRRDL